MTDAQAASVSKQVDSYLRVSKLVACSESGFIGLTDYVKGTCCLECSEEELYVVTAMCFLGPGSIGRAIDGPAYGAISYPPEILRDQLLNLIHNNMQNVKSILSRVFEFTIAFGCGKWRTVRKNDDSWDGRWQGAFRALAGLSMSAVIRSNAKLAQPGWVVGFPNRELVDLTGDSHRLAHSLIHPLGALHVGEKHKLCISRSMEETVVKIDSFKRSIPPGGRFDFFANKPILLCPTNGKKSIAASEGKRVIVMSLDEKTTVSVAGEGERPRTELKDGEDVLVEGPFSLNNIVCGCGNVNCLDRHALSGWDPYTASNNGKQISLTSFVSSAIVGPDIDIKTNTFVQGMYYPLLCCEGF